MTTCPPEALAKGEAISVLRGLLRPAMPDSQNPNLSGYCEERSDEAIHATQRMKEEKQFAVYIMANYTNSTLYVGMSSVLKVRVWQHKEKCVEGFTSRYNINKLVYFEVFEDGYEAAQREHQIKAGSRKKKIALIESMNPEWKDLYDDLDE